MNSQKRMKLRKSLDQFLDMYRYDCKMVIARESSDKTGQYFRQNISGSYNFKSMDG